MPISLEDVLVIGLVAFAITYALLDASLPIVALPRELIRDWLESRAKAAAERSADRKGFARKRSIAGAIVWSSFRTLSGCSWCFGFWASIMASAWRARWVKPFDGWLRGGFAVLAAWMVCGIVAAAVGLIEAAHDRLDPPS